MVTAHANLLACTADLKQHALEDHYLGIWKDDGGPVAFSDQRVAGLWGALNAFVPSLTPGEGFFQTRREVINRLLRILEESGFAKCVACLLVSDRLCRPNAANVLQLGKTENTAKLRA